MFCTFSYWGLGWEGPGPWTSDAFFWGGGRLTTVLLSAETTPTRHQQPSSVPGPGSDRGRELGTSWFSFFLRLTFPLSGGGGRCPCPGPCAPAGDSMALLSLLSWALPFTRPPAPLKLLWTCRLDLLFSQCPALGPGRTCHSRAALTLGRGQAPSLSHENPLFTPTEGWAWVLNKD